MDDSGRCKPRELTHRKAEEFIIATDREAAEREKRHPDHDGNG
jgi:hypothetical protein